VYGDFYTTLEGLPKHEIGVVEADPGSIARRIRVDL
jgi:hypothetical protein